MSATRVTVNICYQLLSERKSKNNCHFRYMKVSRFFFFAVLTFTGNSTEDIWENCCNPFHDNKGNEMLFYADAGRKCSIQPFIPHIFGSHEKFWENDYSTSKWLPYDFCMQGGERLNQNHSKLLENKTHSYWLLEAKYGSKIKNSESCAAHGKTTQHFWIIKRWQWKSQKRFDPSKMQRAMPDLEKAFPLISSLRKHALHFKRQLPPWFPAKNICNFKQHTNSITHLYRNLKIQICCNVQSSQVIFFAIVAS